MPTEVLSGAARRFWDERRETRPVDSSSRNGREELLDMRKTFLDWREVRWARMAEGRREDCWEVVWRESIPVGRGG